MIYVEILKDVEVDCVANICCVSGNCNRTKVKLKQGSKLSFFDAVHYGPARGEIKNYDFLINNKNADTLHPDRLLGVPTKAFIFREPIGDRLWGSDGVEKWTDAYLRITGNGIKDEHIHYLEYYGQSQGRIRTPGHLVVVTHPGSTYIYSMPAKCSLVGRGFHGWANAHFLTDVVY